MNKNTFLKGFLPFASVTLLLGSCSEDKTVPGDNDGQAIVFRVQNALPSSRVAGTTAGYMDAFVINGLVDRVDEDRKSGLTLFDHTTVSRIIGSGANVFTYSPTKYYPKGATKAEFSAFSPVSSRIAASDFQTNDNSITYSVPSPARGSLAGDVDVAPQEDLLVAHTRKDDLSGAVVLQFRHALSRVSVKAVNLIDQPVRIHALSLHNLHVKGTLDIDEKKWNDQNKADINDDYVDPPLSGHGDYKVLWTPTDEPNKALAWQLAESGVMVPVGGSPVQVTADDQALLVLPQTTQNTGNDAKADPSDFYLEVTYTVGNITETIPAYFNDINKLTPDNNQGLTFEMGRQYAINVSITATGLSFGLEVKNWDEPPATQFVVNFDANGGTGAATEDLLLWEAGVPYDITVPNNPYYGPLDVYYFLGWSTDPDGIKKSKSTGTLYLPGETISGVTGSMTLYAQWSKPHQTTLDFAFTGMPQFVGIVRNGNFRLEAWGAAGGSQYNQTDYTSGRGGYAAGTLNLLIGDILYVYAGGKGTYVPPETKASNPGGWNGGGPSYKWGGSHYHHASGGGATDFRLINGTWDNSEGLHSRFLVAGGGGAIADYDYNNSNGYAYGGGETGGSTRLNTSNSMGGTQIAGGEGGERGGWGKGISGSFGAGGYLIGDQNCCAGGGGGWYGGGNGPSGGGGGSGFTYTGQEVTTPSAYQVTLKYILSNTSSINGISSMPDYTKTDGLPYMTGNTGDGYARITYLGQ